MITRIINDKFSKIKDGKDTNFFKELKMKIYLFMENKNIFNPSISFKF